MKLWQKVFIGLILGVPFGIYCADYVKYVHPVGEVFLKLIKMIIVPLLFFTLLGGITSMRDPNSIGRIARKAVFAYFGTTCFAVVFGISVAHIMQPGVGVTGLSIGEIPDMPFRDNFNLKNFVLDMIPSNIFVAFSENNIIQVVFFAIFTGIMINRMDSAADPVREFVNATSKLVLKMIAIIVQLSPYASFALTAYVVATQGVESLQSIIHFCFAVVLAYLLQYLIFGLFILIFCRMSPIPFYKKSIEYQMIALSTGSTKASLITTMEVCRQRLGVSETSTSFVLPLGASINMDGLAIRLGLAVLFFAQIANYHLSINDYLVIITTATLGSIGGAGIPGSFIIILPTILTAVGLPIEGIAILVGIDRLFDLFSTAINITGDAMVTLIVDESEGKLNKKIYYED